MYKQISDNALAASVGQILGFLILPLPIYIIVFLWDIYLDTDETMDQYMMQFGRLMVLVHIMLVLIWHFHLGKSLMNISSKTSKKVSLNYEIRNIVSIIALGILFIYRFYKMFTEVWTVNGEGEYSYTFFRNMDLLVLLFAFILFLININQQAHLISRIIRPRMRLVYFMALLFYPFGIFYIQPKLNRVKTKKPKKTF